MRTRHPGPRLQEERIIAGGIPALGGMTGAISTGFVKCRHPAEGREPWTTLSPSRPSLQELRIIAGGTPAFAGMTGSTRDGATTLAQPHQSTVRFRMDILPIACTLTRAELERDAHCLMPGLLKRAPALTPTVNGVRLEFDATDDVLHDIIGVIERERQCCRFLQFALTVPPGGKPFTLEITGPEGTSEFLAEVTTAGTC